MESSNEPSPPSLHRLLKSEDDNHISIKTISSAKMVARRARRRSLFSPERSHGDDIGTSVLAHADFPQGSFTSLNEEHREPGCDKEIAHKIMEEIMNQELAHKKYDAKECASITHEIVDAIQNRVSSVLNLRGFKLVCTCYITKRAKNSMHMESGCAWDERKNTILKDCFVDCVFKNTEIVAVSTVYCVCCKRAEPDITATKPRRHTISEPPRRKELEEKWLSSPPSRSRAYSDE